MSEHGQAKVRRAQLDGEALSEDIELFNATMADSCQAWRDRAHERIVKAAGALTTDKVVRHMDAARGHLATTLVLQGKLPALRRHMVECN